MCNTKFLLFWTFDFERKKVGRFFWGHWSTKKNEKFPKNIEITPYRRVKGTTLHQTPLITLVFWLTLYLSSRLLSQQKIMIFHNKSFFIIFPHRFILFKDKIKNFHQKIIVFHTKNKFKYFRTKLFVFTTKKSSKK